MIQKSYENSKKSLYIVPTPIGNMKDITERAIDILNNVDIVFAEDTRVAKLLLNLLNIKKEVKSSQKFNEKSSSILIIEELEKGNNVALITDRGTPLISDPGSIAAAEIIKKEYNVIALPGATALIPAINMSGLDQSKFIFYGFLSSKENESINELKKIKNFQYTTILYESPHRIKKTLINMNKVLGNRNICIAREISKIHEEIFRGTVTEAIEYFKNPIGEFVIVIESINEEVDYNEALCDVQELVDLGLPSTKAIKYISNKKSISKNILYDLYEEKKI